MESSEVPQPLYVIDGQVMPEDYNLNTIDPEDIESISVLKDGKQTEVYGERAKDGVICITLKKKEEEKPVRFIPVSEPVGDLAGYAEFKLYSAGVFGKVISRKEYESIPNEALAYLYVQHLDNGKKSLHVYTLDYNSIVHLRKCKKTTDINDEKLAGVNEETVILVDGKWDNYEGYLRTLKFRSNKIKEIEYCLKKDKKSVSMISVIFDKEYDDEEYTIRN
jgi:TonB-dependent SusC/RagA subfamily outer membrane receptor